MHLLMHGEYQVNLILEAATTENLELENIYVHAKINMEFSFKYIGS